MNSNNEGSPVDQIGTELYTEIYNELEANRKFHDDPECKRATRHSRFVKTLMYVITIFLVLTIVYFKFK